MDEANGSQKIYDHLETVETGKCNVTKCIDGQVEEEFKYPYMVYCDITEPTKDCQVLSPFKALSDANAVKMMYRDGRYILTSYKQGPAGQ